MELIGIRLLAFIILFTSIKAYKLVMKSMTVEAPDSTEYIPESKMRIHKISRTTQAVNGYFKLVKDFPPGGVIHFVAYEKNGNIYSDSPLFNSTGVFCEWIEKSTIMYPLILEHSNIPKKCPFKANVYEINDLQPVEIPGFMIPGGNQLKFCLRLYDSIKMDVSLFGNCVHLEVDRTDSILGKLPF